MIVGEVGHSTWEMVHVVDAPGLNFGWPIFEGMVKDLLRHKADGLIVHKIDRSARNFADWAKIGDLQDAGIDTEDVVRTAMVAFMEGAVVEGIFHGDLHGGNLFVLADGRTALLDHGIVGRLTGARRNAFLRLMLGATTNDVKGQMAALRDLGLGIEILSGDAAGAVRRVAGELERKRLTNWS